MEAKQSQAMMHNTQNESLAGLVLQRITNAAYIDVLHKMVSLCLAVSLFGSDSIYLFISIFPVA